MPVLYYQFSFKFIGECLHAAGIQINFFFVNFAINILSKF